MEEKKCETEVDSSFGSDQNSDESENQLILPGNFS